MSRSPVTLAVSANIGDARTVMLDNRVSALPILDGRQNLVGILTKTDVVSSLDHSLPVAILMTTDVFTCTPDTPVWAAAREMRTRRVHHLVAVEDGKVQGMVSVFDLLEFFDQAGSSEPTS